MIISQTDPSMVFALVLSCALAAVAVAGESVADEGGGATWASTEHGDLLITAMEHAPFPHPSRAEGYTRRDTFYPADEHYGDASVAVFIPEGYAPGADGAVDVLFYFHGHGNHVRQTLGEIPLLEVVAKATRPRVLVFPQGPYVAPDSSGGRLEEAGEAEALVDEVLGYVGARLGREVVPGRVTLSGHSGAYRVITQILAHGAMGGRVDEVLLLDATYGGLGALADWATEAPGEGSAERRLRSVFTAHLADENTWLMAELRSRGQAFLLTRNDLLDGDDAAVEPASGAACLFVHTDESHNAAREWLGRWLAE
ncbi:MAG: hypothetical protein AAF078_00210 [Planctomycetota bacterium]